MQVDGYGFEDGSRAWMKAFGIGKLRPNILMVGHKGDWQKCASEDLEAYFEVLHQALDMYMGVGILRLQNGLDVSDQITDDHQNGTITRNQSYSHLSHTSSCSDISVPATRIAKNKNEVNNSPNADDDALPKKKIPSVSDDIPCDGQGDHGGELSKEIWNSLLPFQKKRKRGGTIDVWWLYDDGGLTLLLPYIISTRRSWSNCKLRVFALANKRDELEFENRNMASLLAKFRIGHSALNVVPDITSKASDSTRDFFESLIAGFRVPTDKDDPDSMAISDAELLAVKDKTNRHMRLRKLLLEQSRNASLVVMTLPMPRKNIVSAPLYLAWLELLTKDMPPMLLVRGNQTSVLTFYS